MAVKIKQKYVAIPCNGNTRLSLEFGHVYSVYESYSPDNYNSGRLGVMTEQEAKKKYGAENVFFVTSGNTRTCPTCWADIEMD